MTNIFKREITIHDKDGKKFDLVISNEGCGGNHYFSICSQSGQGQFNPKTESQKELLNIWNNYHLLNINRLPVAFNESLFQLIDELIEEEDEFNERKITIEDLDNEEFLEHANENCEGEVDKLMAACLHCGVSWSGLENVACNGDGSYWDIEGWDYYIYTDEEADEAHLKNIENFVDDIGFEGFNKNYIEGPYVTRLDNGNIEVKMSVEIGSSERGNALAGYDGHENEVDINGTIYYLYRNN